MADWARTYAPWIAGGALIAAVGGGAYGLTSSSKAPAVDSTRETVSLVVETESSTSSSSASSSAESSTAAETSQEDTTKTAEPANPPAPAAPPVPAAPPANNNGQVPPYVPPPNIQTWDDDDDWDDDWDDDDWDDWDDDWDDDDWDDD